MKVPELFREYVWLVNTIHNAGRITLEDINERWQQTELSGGLSLPRSTFNRHKDAIEDIFGLIIDCDKRDGYKYYIANERVLKEDTVQNWMLSAITVSNLIGESVALQDRILLENIPVEGERLRLLTESMKQNMCVSIDYQRYGSSDTKTFILAPYCLKLFRQRWYLLGRFPNGGFGIFAFDRMLDVSIANEKFKLSPDFDAADFFSECFGIVIGDNTPKERVVLRAYNTEVNRMRDLPLHTTQSEIATTKEYAEFELYLRPTLDFVSHILSRSNQVQVLEPKWLADEICQMHLDAIDRYKKIF